MDDDDEPPMICPVTGQVCLTEQDEFCEDYGCARKAGIDVDRLIASQEPLGKEFEKVLHDNLWALYAR